jgi:hypothetical protein
VALEFTKPVTDISIRIKKRMFLGSRARLVLEVYKLTTTFEPDV